MADGMVSVDYGTALALSRRGLVMLDYAGDGNVDIALTPEGKAALPHLQVAS